jgi:hypothetical protein
MKEFIAQYKGVQADGELFERLLKKASDAPSPKRQRKAARTSR